MLSFLKKNPNPKRDILYFHLNKCNVIYKCLKHLHFEKLFLLIICLIRNHTASLLSIFYYK